MKHFVSYGCTLILLFSVFTVSAINWNKEKISEDLAKNGWRYLSDTLMDVNADGQKELIVDIFVSANYPFTFKGIYFNDTPDSLNYLLPNPTYYPEEKMVRCVYGVDYYDGIMLEKYKWEGNLLHMVEKLVVMGTEEPTYLHGDFNEHITKDNIPAEYLTVNGFDFLFRIFIGNKEQSK